MKLVCRMEEEARMTSVLLDVWIESEGLRQKNWVRSSGD